jgi:hypothetical protein
MTYRLHPVRTQTVKGADPSSRIGAVENVAAPYPGRESEATGNATGQPGRSVLRAIIAGVTRTGIETGFLLDLRWRLLRGEMEQSKEPALLLIGRIFAETGVPYAIIGGLALQMHQPEPRTTLDIDLAVPSRAVIPRRRLEEAGFVLPGQFAHPENWLGPGNTPVQVTDDPALYGAIGRAEEVSIGGVPLRIIGRADLLHEKLRAASDPARRRPRRLQDLADVHALIEAFPELTRELSAAERARLDALPG